MKKNSGNHNCFYCQRAMNTTSTNLDTSRTRDHITPLSAGGLDLPYNIVYACRLCNSVKAGFLPIEFLYELTGKLVFAAHRNLSTVSWHGREIQKDTLLTMIKNTLKLI